MSLKACAIVGLFHSCDVRLPFAAQGRGRAILSALGDVGLLHEELARECRCRHGDLSRWRRLVVQAGEEHLLVDRIE